MTRYLMVDGAVVDTRRAKRSWEGARDWDGRNHIYRSTGDQWRWETLYQSSKDRYYLVFGSMWQGQLETAQWIDRREATKWLLENDEAIPEDLAELVDTILE